MSGSGRKRSSKWDLRDELEFAPGSKQMRSGRSSANVAGSNSSKLYYSEANDTLKPVKGFSSEESFSGGSGSNKDDIMHKEHRVIDATKEWENDGSHRQKMSPRIEEWKQKSHSQSPENGWSRSVRSSRSRSPPNSGRSNGPCINFAKGRCRMGTSCKFVHHNNSDGYGKVYMDDLTREKDMDRRRRDSSFEQGGGHRPSRTSDTPCKFFANGNCRNGKYCRFSHDSQLYGSPNRRFRDDRRASNPGGDHQMLDRQRPSDFINPIRRPKDDRWGSDVNVANTVQIRDSPKQNDTIAVYDTAKLIENKSGNVGATEPGFTAWPRDGSYHGLDKSQVQDEPPFLSDKKEADSWRAENTDNMHGSQSIARGILLGDAEMSPDWNYRMGSSCQSEEQGQNKHGISQRGTYLATSEQDRIQVAPGQGFNQSAQNVNHLHTSNYHAVEQSQVAVPIVSNLPSTGGIVDATHNKQVSTQEKYTVEPNIMDAGLSQVSSRSPPTPNTVRNEQLAQLTNLSASLAHILGAGQQLPQLYAVLNSQDLKDTPVAKTEVPAMSVSDTCIKPDAVVGFPEQYDPMCDSMEPKNADVRGMLPAIPPSKKIAEDEAEIPSQLSNSGRQICGDSFRAASSELVKSDHLIQSQSGQSTEVTKGNNEVVAEGRQNSQDDTKENENAPSKKMDQNYGPDEAKKTKDVKGIRPFKFALVEFVKELLKPTWKEGQITKEDYKSIVKKVVDKVTGTMQEAQIPQTQEKIDHYLSCSKPKLNKLVQAYVEKVEKVQKKA